MEFIHQSPEWPYLTWDYNALADRLAEVRYNQGLLLGHMRALGFDLRSEAALTTVTSDVITSSAIEGESLDPKQVHFEAPQAKRVDREMRRFLDWFNRKEDTDPILKAGIAHFRFVTIHPFDDGNGRIARAIAGMFLARADGSADRFYSMSSQIEAERNEYYRRLEEQQRGDVDITPWLQWFLGCLDRSFDRAQENLKHVMYKARVRRAMSRDPHSKPRRRPKHQLSPGGNR